MFLTTLKPQVRSSPGSYRSVLRGIAISVSQPRSVICERTVQSPSQFGLYPLTPPRCDPAAPAVEEKPPVWPSAATWPSYSRPTGLVPKRKAFWLSLKVSSTIWIESVSLSSASRRLSVTRILSGSESKAMIPM
jgi:hypothetical protein